MGTSNLDSYHPLRKCDRKETRADLGEPNELEFQSSLSFELMVSMEDLLRWLEDARAISDSAKHKITNAASPPQVLVDQLRKDLILVQLAQILDKDMLQDSINVRPTTDILKEQNFKNFLKACKARNISIPKPLRRFRGMDLQNFDHILEILFKVSKEIARIDPKIEPLKSIPIINHTGEIGRSPSDDIYESPYELSRTSDVKACYEDLGKLSKRDASKTGIENAFDELLAVESRYITRLKVLVKLSSKCFRSPELRGWFLELSDGSSLLLKFHLGFKKRLDETTINDFCHLFDEFKCGFTYYGPLIISCVRVKHKLKRISQESSLELQNAFKDVLQNLMATENPDYDSPSPTELLDMPFTHIMRYLLMLKRFREEAKPQKFFLNGLAQAIDVMKDVNNFINLYIHDTDNMEATRLAVSTIHFPQGRGSKKSGKPAEFHRDFGRLMLDGKMKIAQNTNGKSPKTKYVMGFEFAIFIMRISSGVSFRDNELTHEKSIYTKDMRSIQDDEKSLVRIFMRDDDCSFSIVETNPSKRMSIKSLLENLCPKVSTAHQCGGNPHTQVPPRYVLGMDPDPRNLTRWLAFCQSPNCNRLLAGRITIGVKCAHCNQLYHEHCYYKGYFKSTNSSEEDDEQVDLPQRSSLLGLGHVAIGDRSFKSALTSNSQYPTGTYLIYCNEDEQNFVVAVKIKSGKKKVQIHKYTVVCEGNHKFYLEDANVRLKPFSAFNDLLNFYSIRFKLKDNLMELLNRERQRTVGYEEAFIDEFSDDSDADEPKSPSNSSESESNRNASGRISQCEMRSSSGSEFESDATSDATSDTSSHCTSDPGTNFEHESDSDSDANKKDVWEGYNFNELIQNDVDDEYAKSLILKQRPGVFMITFNKKANNINIYVARKGKKITKIALAKTSTGFRTVHESGKHYLNFSDLMVQIQTKTKVALKPLLLSRTKYEPCLDADACDGHQADNATQRSGHSNSSKQSFQSALEMVMTKISKDGHMGATSKELSNRQPLVPGASEYSLARSGEPVPSGSRNRTIEDPNQLPFYVGEKDKLKAAELLSNQKIGTFLLRKNVQGQYRITLKQRDIIKHLIVKHVNGLYWSGSQSGQTSNMIDAKMSSWSKTSKRKSHETKLSRKIQSESSDAMNQPPGSVSVVSF